MKLLVTHSKNVTRVVFLVLKTTLLMFTDQPGLFLVAGQFFTGVFALLILESILGVRVLAEIVRFVPHGMMQGIFSFLLAFGLLVLGGTYMTAAMWGCLVDATNGRLESWAFWVRGVAYFERTFLAGLITFGIIATGGAAATAWFLLPIRFLPVPLLLLPLWVLPGLVGGGIFYFWITFDVPMLWGSVMLSHDPKQAFETAQARWRELLFLWISLDALVYGFALIEAACDAVGSGKFSLSPGPPSLELGMTAVLLLMLRALVFVAPLIFSSLASLLYYRSAIGLAEATALKPGSPGYQPPAGVRDHLPQGGW